MAEDFLYSSWLLRVLAKIKVSLKHATSTICLQPPFALKVSTHFGLTSNNLCCRNLRFSISLCSMCVSSYKENNIFLYYMGKIFFFFLTFLYSFHNPSYSASVYELIFQFQQCNCVLFAFTWSSSEPKHPAERSKEAGQRDDKYGTYFTEKRQKTRYSFQKYFA